MLQHVCQYTLVHKAATNPICVSITLLLHLSHPHPPASVMWLHDNLSATHQNVIYSSFFFPYARLIIIHRTYSDYIFFLIPQNFWCRNYKNKGAQLIYQIWMLVATLPSVDQSIRGSFPNYQMWSCENDGKQRCTQTTDVSGATLLHNNKNECVFEFWFQLVSSFLSPSGMKLGSTLRQSREVYFTPFLPKHYSTQSTRGC